MAPRCRFFTRGITAGLFALAPAAQDTSTAALADALAAGRWHRGAEFAYANLALARAREHCGDRVPAEFWKWLDRTPKVRDVIVWATAWDPPLDVFVRLHQLRVHDAEGVTQLPHLAVGFAFAWSAGDHDAPRRRWESWTRGRAPIPSMQESFSWYVKHRSKLAFAIHKACWQLLAYTALNDVPFDERAWALDRFRGKKVAELRGIFAEVPYVHEGIDDKAATLPNMVEFGGVCTVNTQYQMAVMRTLGVPATYGGGPGHCWPCWIGGPGRQAKFGRVNDLGNADGTLGEWGLDGHRHESDLRLLATAIAHSRPRLREAELCAAAARALGDAAPQRMPAALAGVIDRNPYALRAWTAAARSIAAQRTPRREAIAQLRSLSKKLPDQPRAVLQVLRAAIPEQPTESFDSKIHAAFTAACQKLSAPADVAAAARRCDVEFHERTGDRATAARLRFEVMRAEQDDGGATDSAGLVRTRSLGGQGGSPFVGIDDKHLPLTGVRYTTAHYSGYLVIASIQPLFRDGERQIEGAATYGEPRGAPSTLLAHPGTAIVGAEVQCGDLLDGFRLVCAPRSDGAPDLSRIRFTDWVGGGGDRWGKLLGGSGAPIVGVHGRCGSMIDAFGLISDPGR